MKKIPISLPNVGDEEIENVASVIKSGWVTQGPRVAEFEKNFADKVGAEYACAVSSCTTALHCGLLAVGVKPGDIVLTVSHSFIATANSIRYCNAEPYFVDIDLDTFNMSPSDLGRILEEKCFAKDGNIFLNNFEELAQGESPLVYIKPELLGKVSAIMVVHQIGMPCDMQRILAIAKKFNLPVVEDAACAIGSETSFDQGKTWEFMGKPHGDVACFSFHPRKVLTTGDGGMITTNNSKHDEQFRLLRQHGMNIPDSARHGASKVIIENYDITAFNYRMTDVQAAMGIEQLKRLTGFTKKRRELDKTYKKLLAEVSWLQLPLEPDYARSNWQSYCILLKDSAPISQNELLQKFLDNGVSAKPGIMNSHEEKPYNFHKEPLPNSEKARKQGILLPMYQDIGSANIEKIANLLKSI